MGRDVERSGAYQDCLDEAFHDRAMNEVFGHGQLRESCKTDGTMVLDLFVDSMDRSTVQRSVSPDGMETVTLQKQDVSFTVDRRTHVLSSFSDGKHLYSFDPDKQIAFLNDVERKRQLEDAMIIDRSDEIRIAQLQKVADEKVSQPRDLGGGLIGSLNSKGLIVFQLPDGGPSMTMGDRGVNSIYKNGKYSYQFDSSESKEDPNLPKDQRLNDPEAIKQDALDAITGSGRYFSDGDGARSRFSEHLAEMPANKQAEYLGKIQKAVEEQEKHEDYGFQRQLTYELARDGSVQSVTMINGHILPYVPNYFDTTTLYSKPH